MFGKKSKEFDYIQCLKSINKELRNRELEKYDDSIETNTSILMYNLNDMNKLLKSTVYSTRDLLKQKGFSLSLKDRVEKSVLLNTEISELADAVKKGYGANEEGYEIADIVIRAANFLCLDETFHQYEKLSYAISSKIVPSEVISVTVKNPDSTDIKKIKYELIEDMMCCWIEVKKASDMLDISYNNKLGEEKLISSFIVLWNKIVDLCAYCSAYVTLYLPKNLQFYVAHKMDKNFKRPYRYGTSEEIK